MALVLENCGLACAVAQWLVILGALLVFAKDWNHCFSRSFIVGVLYGLHVPLAA